MLDKLINEKAADGWELVTYDYMATSMQIKGAFEQKKVPFWVESFTNQQFVILSDEQKKTLARKYYFEEMGRENEGTVVRFCTSWATKQEEVDALVLDISKLV